MVVSICGTPADVEKVDGGGCLQDVSGGAALSVCSVAIDHTPKRPAEAWPQARVHTAHTPPQFVWLACRRFSGVRRLYAGEKIVPGFR